MADPYWKYTTTTSAPPPPAERSSVQFPSFPGYFSSEASTLTTHRPWSSTDVRQNSNILQNDLLPARAGEYPVDSIRAIHPEIGLGRLSSGASIAGHSSPSVDPRLLEQRHDFALGDPRLLEQRQDIAPSISPLLHDIDYERSNSHRRTYDLPPSVNESNVLFVDGLPTDCSRREVGHLFRPFIGFRELKLVHKEPRKSGDKAMVLCFVEFTDSKCALTAMEALQGYKFDDKKPNSGVLDIQFAHFPIRRPSSHDIKDLGAQENVKAVPSHSR